MSRFKPEKIATIKKFGVVILFVFWFRIGISRDNLHKRRATGGKRKIIRKKRKYDLGRPAANTKVMLIFFFTLFISYFCDENILRVN